MAEPLWVVLQTHTIPHYSTILYLPTQPILIHEVINKLTYAYHGNNAISARHDSSDYFSEVVSEHPILHRLLPAAQQETVKLMQT